MTNIQCDEESCVSETTKNHMDQWAQVKIDLHDVSLEVHFCPTCWSKILVRRALSLKAEAQ